MGNESQRQGNKIKRQGNKIKRQEKEINFQKNKIHTQKTKIQKLNRRIVPYSIKNIFQFSTWLCVLVEGHKTIWPAFFEKYAKGKGALTVGNPSH